MRLVFMGTPHFSIPVLNELLVAGHEIPAVYTRAPQPSGRGRKLKNSPVHAFAESCGLEVRTPKNFKAENERTAFASLAADAAIVVAYGLLLPQEILDAPRYGCLNLHASLLPRWRGAAPIQRAIMAGDDITGIQVMRMEAGLDTGAILLSESTKIEPQDTAGTLHDRLSQIGAQLAPRALAALERGALMETPQAEGGVTYAHKISAGEVKIDWHKPAAALDCHIRGLSPFPGAWFASAKDGGRIKVLFSAVAEGAGAPGEILEAANRLVVACADDALSLETLQREGKKAQSFKEFLRGFPLVAGERI